jgi:hypothetical protein
MSGRLFISHASEDAAIADSLMGYLESHGLGCWISSRDIPPQAIYADAITEAMQTCSACAVLISRAANQSKAVKRELELASHYDKPFIPIRIDGAEPAAGLDYYLRNVQWMDYRRDGEQALDGIVAHLQGAPPPRAPASARRWSAAAVLIGVVLLLAGIGGWFTWTQWKQPAQTTTALPIDLAGSMLTGSYHWEGVSCGDGPTVTQEHGVLVFTMPGAATYRHTVLSAEPATGGYALRVETRVAEPPESRGQVYTLGVNRDTRSVDVISGRRTDVWQRCDSR